MFSQDSELSVGKNDSSLNGISDDDELTAVISRLQALESGGASATTSTAPRFRSKEATDHKPLVMSGGKKCRTVMDRCTTICARDVVGRSELVLRKIIQCVHVLAYSHHQLFYLEDQVPVSMMLQGSPSSRPNMVRCLTTGEYVEQGEDEVVRHEVTQNEIFALVRQFRKGTGNGKGKGKKGACWNCGENDHFSRDCPNDKQDSSWTDGGT